MAEQENQHQEESQSSRSSSTAGQAGKPYSASSTAKRPDFPQNPSAAQTLIRYVVYAAVIIGVTLFLNALKPSVDSSAHGLALPSNQARAPIPMTDVRIATSEPIGALEMGVVKVRMRIGKTEDNRVPQQALDKALALSASLGGNVLVPVQGQTGLGYDPYTGWMFSLVATSTYLPVAASSAVIQ